MEIQDLKERLRKSLQVIQKLQGQLDAAKQTQASAVIGVSCRLPGGIDDMDGLWDFLYKGGNAITGYPTERLEGLGYEENDIKNTKGGFIKDIELFDPAFFNIGLQEAAAMDPQHRILLEMVWRAFEDAGLDIHNYRGKRVGVFIALSNNDYSLQRLRSEHTNPYDFTGNILAPAAGRISYTFDFRGPCTVVDTACSSALVAFHQAHTALGNNECDLAIVGGINLLLDLGINKALQSIDALAADGYCKPLDASADGYTRSEGGGVLLLQRASEATNEGNKPYCIVKGSYLNHDGRSNGFTAPSGHAQEAVLNGALKNAGISNDDIDYIELHGTGTALGDPIEIDAIQNTFLSNGREKPLYVGSVKSNVGHLECAAGLAGLLKSILVLKHKIVPPTIHIRKLNPLIEWQKGLEVPLMPQRINNGGDKIRIGISSFGISGTNAHIIIETPDVVAIDKENNQPVSEYPLFLSAATPKALKELVTKYINFLGKTQAAWGDICAAAARRAHLSYRVAITAPSVGEGIEKLKQVTVFDKEIRKIQVAGNTGDEIVGKGLPLLSGNEKQQAELLLSKNGHGIAALLALFYSNGIDCNWPLFMSQNANQVAVPGYPFQKTACWVNKEKPVQSGSGLGMATGHPVFTQQFTMPGNSNTLSFTGVVNADKMSCLKGHLLFDTVIYPGAGFLEWMLFAANKVGEKSVTQLVLKEPLALQPGVSYAIWLQADKTNHGYTCKAYSRVQGDDGADWVLHATASLTNENTQPSYHTHLNGNARHLDIPTFYERCRKSGIGYTGAFALLGEAKEEGSMLEGTVNWKAPVQEPFLLHPALLDNCFQLLGAYIMTGETDDAYVPYKMNAVTQYGTIEDGEVKVWVQLPGKIQPGFQSLTVDISVWQHDRVVAEIQGFHLVKVSREQLALPGNELKQDVYTEQWVDMGLQPVKDTKSIYAIPALEKCLDETNATIAERAAKGLAALEGLAIHWCAHILNELGVAAIGNKSYTQQELINVLNLDAKHTRLFERLLFAAIANGWAGVENGVYTFTNVPATDMQECIEKLEHKTRLQAELNVLNRCAGNITAILKGEANPVEVLFPSGSIEYVKALYASDAFKVMHGLTASCFKEFINTNSDKGPIRILEIGAGTGSTTQHILPMLQGMPVTYDFTDISPLFLYEAQGAFGKYNFINYKVLDVEKDLAAQGYGLGSYDLIIASNVLHATRSLQHTFGQVKSLLKNNGVLFMVEGTSQLLWIDLIFGITSGWWLFDDTNLRPSHALLAPAQWNTFLSGAGYSDIQVLSPVSNGKTASGQSVIWASKAETILNTPVDEPVIITINAQEATVDSLTNESLKVFSALSLLKEDDKQRTIILLATGRYAQVYTGLWRSLQNECKHWDIRLVITDEADVKPAINIETAMGLPGECSRWQGGNRQVLRLTHAEIPSANKTIDWRGKDILITGGAGGIGLQLADWLLAKGAGKIYLTGRSSDAGLNNTDKRLSYIQSDIAETIPTIEGNIYAVFHLAGVVADNSFGKQNTGSFHAVLNPKVKGTDKVLKLAKAHHTKHIVLFSSSACMLGTVGQTNHALGSSYLQHAAGVQDGFKVTSIAWGPWKGAGAVEKYSVDDIAARIGVTATSAAANFGIMEQLMVSNEHSTGVFKADWNMYAASMKPVPYWKELQQDDGSVEQISTADFKTVINGGIEATIQYLRDIVSKVLGYKEMQVFDADAGFFDIGLDSLTALDLKTRLQEATKTELPSTLVFKYPNIRSLGQYLIETYTETGIESSEATTEQWDASVDALKFIEEEFNNLFDEGTAVK